MGFMHFSDGAAVAWLVWLRGARLEEVSGKGDHLHLGAVEKALWEVKRRGSVPRKNTTGTSNMDVYISCGPEGANIGYCCAHVPLGKLCVPDREGDFISVCVWKKVCIWCGSVCVFDVNAMNPTHCPQLSEKATVGYVCVCVCV